MKISVIVSTYNRPDALERVLAALADQVEPPAEVVVADDGSGPQTRELLVRTRESYPVPLRHVWHEDDGFRVAAIRNQAAALSVGDWFQFIDGDCVPRRHFVHRVRRLAQEGQVLAGDRVLLSRVATERMLRERDGPQHWTLSRWIAERRSGGVNRLTPFLYWPFVLGRGLQRSRWQHLRGACIGIHRRDFERVNGFEEAFSGWGLEDSELAVRLINAGIAIRSGRFALGLIHLWHPENSRGRLERNEQLLARAQASRKRWASCGFEQARARANAGA
ncbi:MAG: glycosyltransferase [Burkholderiaceae bacterium]